MNTNTTAKLEELLLSNAERADGAITKAVDFTIEQAPLFVEELLNYAFMQGLITMLIPAVVFIVAAAAALAVVIHSAKQGGAVELTDPGPIVIFMTSLAICTFAFCVTLTEAHHFINHGLKAKLAPRVYLVEWVTDRTGNHP